MLEKYNMEVTENRQQSRRSKASGLDVALSQIITMFPEVRRWSDEKRCLWGATRPPIPNAKMGMSVNILRPNRFIS